MSTSLVCYPEAQNLNEVVVLENIWRAKKELASFLTLYLAFGRLLPDDILDHILSFSRHRAVEASVWRGHPEAPILRRRLRAHTIYKVTLVPLAHTLLPSGQRKRRRPNIDTNKRVAHGSLIRRIPRERLET